MTKETQKPFYVKKLDNKIHAKLEKIGKETGVAKWMIAEKLLGEALGVKTKNKLDLTKWLKLQ